MQYAVGDIVHYMVGGGDKYGRVTVSNPPQYTVVQLNGPGPNAAEIHPQVVHNITDIHIIPAVVIPAFQNDFNNNGPVQAQQPQAQGRRRRNTRRRRANRRRRNTRARV
jgi:hypothetical protein